LAVGYRRGLSHVRQRRQISVQRQSPRPLQKAAQIKGTAHRRRAAKLCGDGNNADRCGRPVSPDRSREAPQLSVARSRRYNFVWCDGGRKNAHCRIKGRTAQRNPARDQKVVAGNLGARGLSAVHGAHRARPGDKPLEALQSETSGFPLNLPIPDLRQSVLNLANRARPMKRRRRSARKRNRQRLASHRRRLLGRAR